MMMSDAPIRRIAAALLAALLLVPAAAFGQTEDGPVDNDDRQDEQMVDAGAETLSLQSAASIAVKNNHDVEISRQQRIIAERNVSVGNAGMLPTVDAFARQNRVFGGPGLFGQDQIRTTTGFGLRLDYVIFGGLGRLADLRRLKDVRAVADLQTQVDIEATIEQVVIGYWTVVQQKELLEALRETRDVSQTRVEIARSRLKAGTGSQTDLNLARVQLNTDKSAVAEQKIAVTEAKTELNRLMGRQADQPFEVTDTFNVDDSLVYDDVRETALSANRQLRAVQRETDIAEEEIRASKSQWWPSLNASLAYNYQEFHEGVAPNFDTEPEFSYTFNLSIPIFQGLNVLRQVRNARTSRTVADIEVAREKTRIRADVRRAYEAYDRHMERVELARESVELARQNVEVALTELRAGTITQIDYRQVQLDLRDAQIRLIEAKFQAKQAEVQLERLAGALYDAYI
jgi:outer membrane protein TolC